MRYDAFISYRRDNGFLMAQVIRERLKEQGISCFLDLEEDRAGKFDETLLKAIECAPNFILVLPKNALNRCNKEDDWVRREILAAVEGKKNIIPVIYDGFSWPKKWREGIPEEIRELRFLQSVSMSREYLSAMIDKIVSYMKDVTTGPAGFFQVAQRSADACGIDMAFHSGAVLRREPSRVKALTDLLERKVPLRVLVNTPEAAESVCSAMRQPLNQYVGFADSVAQWQELAGRYPGLIQVRTVTLPLMHRIYLLRRNDGTGVAELKYYTYGNCIPEKDFRQSFSSQQPEYELYRQEFEYLWERAAEAGES